MHPKAFDTNIPVTNKDFYNIIGANKVNGSGLLDNRINARVFTVDVLEWAGKKDEQKTAVYFGFDKIMVLHDPTVVAVKSKKTEEKTEEVAKEGETK